MIIVSVPAVIILSVPAMVIVSVPAMLMASISVMVRRIPPEASAERNHHYNEYKSQPYDFFHFILVWST